MIMFGTVDSSLIVWGHEPCPMSPASFVQNTILSFWKVTRKWVVDTSMGTIRTYVPRRSQSPHHPLHHSPPRHCTAARYIARRCHSNTNTITVIIASVFAEPASEDVRHDANIFRWPGHGGCGRRVLPPSCGCCMLR